MFLACRDTILGGRLIEPYSRDRASGFKSPYDELRGLGLKSFEMGVGRDFKPVFVPWGDFSDKSDRKRLMEELDEEEVSICALLAKNDFSSEDLEKEVDFVIKVLKLASDLGVGVVRINSWMGGPNGYDFEDRVRRVVKALKECLPTCESTGVSLAIENHGTLGNNREFLQEVFGRADHELIGLTLDTGNFYWSGYPLSEVYEIIDGFAEKVKHTHFKNATAPPGDREKKRSPREVTMTPLYEGDIDMQHIIEILKKTGYDYDITLEDESLGRYDKPEWIDIIRKDIEHLKKFI